ncbi:MAG: hypothetical protein ACQEQA_04865 [Bacillota bacterium]
MRNAIVLILFIAVFVVAIIREPVDDTLDVMAGSTNPTYSVSMDAMASATEDDDEDEEDDD